MHNIFDDVSSANMAAYWVTKEAQEAPYLGETLFPDEKQGTDYVESLKGETASPVPLKASAYNAQTIDRDRQGFSKQIIAAKFFKEGQKVDEKLRKQLLNLQNSPYPAQRDAILKKVFDDANTLIRGAKLSREILRMQMLLTGGYKFDSNGQSYVEDFGMDANHIVDAAIPWTDKGSNPLQDLEDGINRIIEDAGVTPTRMVLNKRTLTVLINNPIVKDTLLKSDATSNAIVNKSQVFDYLSVNLGLSVAVYDKIYQTTDENGKKKSQKFIPDGKVVLLPEGDLGKTVFTPTPEELDLMASSSADVAIVDTGVAVTNTMLNDPVTKRTKVSQSVTPTFEAVDQVYVLTAYKPTTGNTNGTNLKASEPEESKEAKPTDANNVEEIKAYLDRHNIDYSGVTKKDELLKLVGD